MIAYIKPKPEQIKTWLERHFPGCKYRKNGTEARLNNPFDGDTGRNLEINLEKATAHDWRGDAWAGINSRTGRPNKRTFLRFVQAFLKCSYREAVRDVCGANAAHLLPRRPAGTQDVAGAAAEGEVAPMTLPSGAVSLRWSPQPRLAGIITRWLLSRGVTDREIDLYKLHHLGDAVIWPYYEYDLLVYWQSRSATDKIFRFPDTSTGASKGQFLYGFDYVEPADYLIVTESIFNMMTLEEQCLASGGADLTQEQLPKIRALGPQKGLILAPDNDAAGVKSVLRNRQLLMPLGYKLYYSLPPALPYTAADGEERLTKDWNDFFKVGMSKPEIRQVFEDNIKPLSVQEIFKLAARARDTR